MENDNKEEVVEETSEETTEETKETTEETKEKPKLTPEQLKGIKQRQFTKLAKELGVELPKPQTEEKKEKKSLDNGDVALLVAKGVADEDISFVEEQIRETGFNLRDLLGKKWFQAELQERKDERTTKDATPKGNNRSSGPAKDSVEYWVGQLNSGKAKLTDISDVELRRRVNNARAKETDGGRRFSSEPVIGG